jgi:hypothetical protein
VGAEHRLHGGRRDDAHIERFRHRFDGDVVVRGTDAAAGEEPVVRFRELLHFADDGVDVVHDDDDPPQENAERAKGASEDGDVRFFDLAGKNLVADDEHGSGRWRRREAKRLVHGPSGLSLSGLRFVVRF